MAERATWLPLRQINPSQKAHEPVIGAARSRSASLRTIIQGAAAAAPQLRIDRRPTGSCAGPCGRSLQLQHGLTRAAAMRRDLPVESCERSAPLLT